MISPNTNDVLNRLLVIHNRSLPMYLSETSPWTHRGDEQAAKTLQHIVADQKTMIDRIAQMILQTEGGVDMGEYPMDFTDTHDLSLYFLLGKLVASQQRDVEAIGRCPGQLNDAPLSKALAQEALGMAKGHLESLQELVGKTSKVAG